MGVRLQCTNDPAGKVLTVLSDLARLFSAEPEKHMEHRDWGQATQWAIGVPAEPILAQLEH